MKVRYIRESMTGSNSNSGCHWCEIQAIDYEGTNVALNKTVTCEGGTYEKGTLDMITNGNTTVDDYIYFRNDAQNTISVTIDLENIEDIDNIKVWHYHNGGRTYKNILLEVSLDGVKWIEIFNSNKNGEYTECDQGKLHKLTDDRLIALNEKSTLKEVVSFYEKYIEQNISHKELIKNILTSREVEFNDDSQMLDLINYITKIKSYKIVQGDNFRFFYLDKRYDAYKNNKETITIFTNDKQELSKCTLKFNFVGTSSYKLYLTVYHRRGDTTVLSKEFDTNYDSNVKTAVIELTDFKIGDTISVYILGQSNNQALAVYNFEVFSGIEFI